MVKKRRERKQIAATMSCCFVCALLGVGAWKYNLSNALNSKGDDGVGLIGAESVGTDAESTGFGAEESTIGTDGSEVTSGGKVQIETEETMPENATNWVHGENVGESQKEAMQQEPVGNGNYEQSKEPTISADGSPLAPERDVLTKEEIYNQIGNLLPDAPPEGYKFEEAYTAEGGFSIRWSKGMEELHWSIRDFCEADVQFLTKAADTENYDLTLYPIPRAESVPEALRQIVDNPIFEKEELSQEVVNARAYVVGDAGDVTGYRLHFSVRYGEKIISVHSKGVSPEWMYDKLSGIEERVIVNDMPLQSEAGDTGALKTFEEVWGGSYMNAQGNWVVWLTEDTTANREEVFKRNPGLSKSSTEFKKAEYSLAYLTQLMADISEAMGNDTLSFVPTAALREDLNRVEVSMSVDSEEAKQKVLAYDKLGGAIVIKTGVANGSKEIFTEELREEVQKGPLR